MSDLEKDSRKPRNLGPELAEYEVDLENALAKIQFQNGEFDKEELENPAEFLQHIYNKSPELARIIEQAPDEKKDAVKQGINDLIQSEVKDRWKSETERKWQTLKESLDQELIIKDEDVKNDDFHEKDKYVESMLARTAVLKEGLSDRMRKKIEDHVRQQSDIAHIQWQQRHEVFHQQEINEGKRKIDSALVLRKEDVENDDFHDKEVFRQTMNERAEAAIQDVPDDLRSDMERHVNEKTDQLFREWKIQHESAEERKITAELLPEITSGPIPPEMAQKHVEATDFPREYWNYLLQNANEDIKHDLQEHPQIFDKIFQKREIQSALQQKFTVYEGEHDKSMEKRFSQELIEKIASAPITDAMAIEHLEEDEFQEHFFEKILEKASPELQEELGEHAGLKAKLLNHADVQKKLKEKFEQYEQKHDTAMEKKFSTELVDLIDSEEISDLMAQEHLSPEAFQKKFFELILKKGSPELLEELQEHQGLEEKLFRNDAVKDKLKAKYEKYDEKHDAAMEKRFSSELSGLINSAEITEKMAFEHLNPSEFRQKFFEEVLKKASPELKEELNHHKDLQEKLFGSTTVQKDLTDKYKEYDEKHGTSMEKKFSNELSKSIDSFKITSDMIKKPMNEKEFSQMVLNGLFKNASPELQEELKEHKGLQTKLSGHKKVQTGIAKQFVNYQKMLKKDETKKKQDEEKAQEEEKKKAKKKETLTADDLESSEKIFTKGLNKVIDMEKGKTRLLELKNIPAIRTLFQNETLKRNFEPFLTEWTAQLKDTEFRAFKLRINRSGITPEQLLQSMTGNLQRRKALQRIKSYSSSTWSKFSNGLRSLEINPSEVAHPTGFKPIEETDPELELEGTETEEQEMTEEELVQRLEEVNAAEPAEKPDDKPEAQRLDHDEASIEEELMGEEEELEKSTEESHEADELELEGETMVEEELMKKELGEEDDDDEDMDVASEDQEEPVQMEKDDEEPETTDVDEELLDTEEKEVETENEDNGKEESGTQTQVLENEEPSFVSEDGYPRLSDDELQESQETIQQQPPLETSDSEEEDAMKVQDEKALLEEQEEISEETEQVEIAEADGPVNEEDLEEKEIDEESNETPLEEPEELSSEDQKSAIQEKKDEEKEETDEKAIIEEAFEVEETLIQVKEAAPQAKMEKKEQKETSPLHELEKFRRELIDRLRRSAREAQKDSEILEMVGIPFEDLVEERSEFIETLRLEMENNSMSLRTLLQKYVRYIRFINDAEIPAFLQLPSEVLERLVLKPAEVFKQLNDFYFGCREHHEAPPRLVFTTADRVKNSDNKFTLQFEVHKKNNGHSCRAFIPCLLVEEEEKKIPQAA